MRRDVAVKKQWLIWLAVASLLGAFVYARLAPGPDLAPLLARGLNAGERLGAETTSDVWEVTDAGGKVVGFLAVGSASGYGGPLTVATRLDGAGKLVGVYPLTQKESPGFFDTVLRGGYLKQFKGMGAGSAFSVGDDIQGVTGATITSRALAGAVADGSHTAGRKVFGLPVAASPLLAVMGIHEWVLIGMLAMSVVLYLRNWTRLRLPFVAVSTVVMGFWLGSMFAVPQLTSLLLGYQPPLREGLRWYILVVGVLGLTVFLGKAWYCYWLCPFGGAQELLAFVGKGMVQPSPRVRKTFAWVRWAVLWASAMVGFVTMSPGAGSVEPFATLFLLKGSTVQWALLIVVLVCSMFLPRFWCNYLCPAGAARDLIDLGRREVLRRWRVRQNTKAAM
jgi:NosR/NirI family transcriptional regulator, nitrous oxide reductase regulator